MLERRIFVTALTRGSESPVQGLLEIAREGRHRVDPYFFSMMHCSGCWCLRAKSMTCVTLVSATS